MDWKNRKKMKLLLRRDEQGESHTYGKLYIDGKYECETLEDAVREKKIPGHTAIPTGTYKVIISYSPRFKQQMPLLLNVPNFIGVRIHSGNTDADTEGCPLVGKYRGKHKGKPAILNSRIAYKAMFAKLESASKKEEITITIE